MRVTPKNGRALVAAALVTLVVGAASGLCLRPVQEAKILPVDVTAPGDYFGDFVALEGDTAVVGANGKGALKGAAYVFTRSAATWTQQGKLLATGGAPGDSFGDCVSISGDSVLVGAGGDDARPGAAFVFTRDGGAWTQQAKLVADDGVNGDTFGLALAISGDTAVVGAYRKNGDRGAAYVFTRSGTTWTQQAKLLPMDGADSDFFGGAVALEDDTAVVGASSKDVGQGAAYVFTRSGTTWTQQAKLVAADAADGDFFGESVSLSGRTVLVGADFENHAGAADAFQGAAYVFVRAGTTWTQQAKLVAPDAEDADFFGYAVAVAGEAAVVGAYGKNFDQGAAYVFTRVGETWSLQSKLLADDGVDDDAFGGGVAISNGTALFGAYGVSENRGAAYVFTGLLPPPAVPYVLPAKVRAKVNAAVPSKSVLTASGTLDTGPGRPDFAGAAALDVGPFHLEVPAFVVKSKGRLLTYTADGITFSIKPAASGSSRATFTVKAVGDFGAGFDPDGPIAFRFVNPRYDARGGVKLTAGALAPGAVVAPDLAVVKASGTLKGGGKDVFALTAGFATTSAAPASPEDVTLCFGNTFTVDLPASAFQMKGAAAVLVVKSGGVTKATVDYAKGLITVAGKGVDLGVFAPGGNGVGVTITLGGVERGAQIRMARARTKLAY